MRTVRRQEWLSPEDYRALELTAEFRHEYVDGEVYAMVGTSKVHSRIVLNLAIALNDAVRGGPCDVFINDVKVRVEAANAYYYPDVVVACDPGDDDPYVSHAPTVVVEVLSPSTEATDRRYKRPDYQKIPSVREILLVAQDERLVELYRRTDEGWLVEIVRDQGAVTLESLGIEVTLDALYHRV